MRGGQPEKIVTEMVISAVVAIVFILFAPFPGAGLPQDRGMGGRGGEAVPGLRRAREAKAGEVWGDKGADKKTGALAPVLIHCDWFTAMR